jgi:hypothetical protein
MEYDELCHLRGGLGADETAQGLGLDSIDVRCDSDAQLTLDRVKECLAMVIEHCDDGADTGVDRELPSWFLNSFVEGSPAMMRYRADNPGKESSSWTLDSWLYWFDSDERMWRWWDAEVISPNMITIRLVALDWPTPTAALKWLLYAAGAISVKYVDDAG